MGKSLSFQGKECGIERLFFFYNIEVASVNQFIVGFNGNMTLFAFQYLSSAYKYFPTGIIIRGMRGTSMESGWIADKEKTGE
jgi:hypothetical protein